jgi:monofunctional glycosyltransferase
MATQKKQPKKRTVTSKNKTSFVQKLRQFLVKSILYFFGSTLLVTLIFKWVPVPFTPLMFVRAYEFKTNNQEIVWKHDWTSINDISLNMQKAVIASEDGSFVRHSGFDFKAIQLAFKNNNRGKKLKGGSTISQQTAKNVFLWQGRSYLRKGLEAYFTVLIELIWGKERIMEVYLNSIEMGNGIYGVEAATQFWYKKSCKSLTKNEAAGIAAILPNPRKFKASNSSAYIERRKGKIIKRMRQVGKLVY